MKKMHVISLIIVSTLSWIAAGSIRAQETSDKARFQFNVDYNRFRYSDSLTYLEFSASLLRSFLLYQPDAERFAGEFIVDARIYAKDSLVASKQWKNVNHVDSLAEINDTQRLFVLNHFLLPDGDYTMSVHIEDGHDPQTHAEYKFPVQTRAYAGSALAVSDLQLSSSIERDTTASFFTKNGYRVVPNPTALYGLSLPILYLYSELYHLAAASSDSGHYYRVIYKIYSSDGLIVKQTDPKRRKKPGESAVEVSGINVVSLVSGAYRVEIAVTDLENGAEMTSWRKFFVYREADYAEGGAVFVRQEEFKGGGSPGSDADRYNVASEKELDREFEYTRYINRKQERDTYKKLNLEGKRNFIKQFWAERDQTPGTLENEFKQDYLGRIEVANRSYRGSFREGWRSDRGRILLVYGRPDEIERFPFSNQNRTYEVWHYYSQQGGIYFYFVDKRDTGELELVHSTARGELYDTEWTRWIDPNS